jgi:hypothetical protein
MESAPRWKFDAKQTLHIAYKHTIYINIMHALLLYACSFVRQQIRGHRGAERRGTTLLAAEGGSTAVFEPMASVVYYSVDRQADYGVVLSPDHVSCVTSQEQHCRTMNQIVSLQYASINSEHHNYL